jgi:hypothetical protein
VAFALPKRHTWKSLRHKGLRHVWHVWRFIGGLSALPVPQSIIFLLFLFSDQGQKQTPQTPHMPQSLTGQGFRVWRFVFPNASHATKTPPKRHTLVASTNRAGSMGEPAPVSLYLLQSLQLPHSYCHTATKPIEAITIGSNNGHYTVPLNTIELQSIQW